MAHIQVNIIQHYSKLEEFWRTGKHTDVAIECDGDTFQCHRVVLASACEYFDTMFSSNFRERTAKSIQICDTDAATFKHILDFVYTGDVSIDTANVLNMLQASELFKLPGIEQLCIQFVEMNSLTVPDTWNTFIFACATNKKTLMHSLSHRIVNRFDIFFGDDTFLEVSFDDLSIILDRLSSLATLDGHLSVGLLDAITRWTVYQGKNALCYLNRLSGMINFKNIPSTSSARSIFETLLANSLNEIPESLEYNEVSKLLRENDAIPATERLLRVLVKRVKENTVEIHSVNNSRVCTEVSAKVPLAHFKQSVCCVALDKLPWYCLNYFYDVPCYEPTFYAHTSLNMRSQMKLKPPPVVFLDTLAVGTQNNIYFYNPYFQSEPVVRTEASNSFNNEEIRRGIYAYNCEIDCWFPVPMMGVKVESACLATCDNILYLVGGWAGSIHDLRVTATAQAYDCREGKWQELRRTHYECPRVASCSMDGKIYVFGGDSDQKAVERYDPVAGRWENLARIPFFRHWYTLAVSYSKEIWLRGDYFRFDIYDTESRNWSVCPVLTDVINTPRCNDIMGGFVF